MPQFMEGREEREAAKKREELGEAIEAALARREPVRRSGRALRDRRAGGAGAGTPGAPPRPPRAPGARLRRRAAGPYRRARGSDGAAGPVGGGAPDAQMERRFGSRLAQRVLFGGMARAFEPDAAAGFRGSLVYELSRPASGERLPSLDDRDRQTDTRPRVPGRRAGSPADRALQLADFLRVDAGAVDPAVPLLENRASFEGEFAVAARLPEMFGAPSPY